MVKESCFSQLEVCQQEQNLPDWTEENTSSVDRYWCGHLIVFGVLELAFEVLFLESGWAVWKDTRRLSYVKYLSATSARVMMNVEW